MTAMIGVVGLDASTRRLIRSLAPLALEEIASASDAIAWVRGLAPGGCALLIGPEVEQAIRLAERVRALHQRTEVMLCAPPDRQGALEEAAQRSPWLGARVRCLSLAEPDALAGALRSVGARLARRRRHEAAVTAAETRLPTLAVRVRSHRSRYIDQLWNLLPLGALVVTAGGGRVLELNREAARLLGAPDEEILGRCLCERFSPGEAERLRAAIEAPDAGEIRLDALVLPASARGARYIDALIAPPDAERSRLVLLQDVTERRLSEEELLRRLSQIEQQRDDIRRLSTPLIQVWGGVLALPVVGRVDRERAGRMTQDLLEAIRSTQARSVILDLTGVPDVDAAAAAGLIGMMRAAGLLGARCLLSGIAPSMARTMIGIGVDLHSLAVFQTLHAALRATML